MGYPMTFRRLVNRNGLTDGNYEQTPAAYQIGVNTNPISPVNGQDYSKELWPHIRERLERYEASMRLLAGDLRRLEKDAVDENALAKHIAARTGVSVDIVASVLK